MVQYTARVFVRCLKSWVLCDTVYRTLLYIYFGARVAVGRDGHLDVNRVVRDKWFPAGMSTHRHT